MNSACVMIFLPILPEHYNKMVQFIGPISRARPTETANIEQMGRGRGGKDLGQAALIGCHSRLV